MGLFGVGPHTSHDRQFSKVRLDSLQVAKPESLAELELEAQNLKIENEQFKEKIRELEKWLVLLLNNFYEGNPNSLQNIEQVSSITIRVSRALSALMN